MPIGELKQYIFVTTRASKHITVARRQEQKENFENDHFPGKMQYFGRFYVLKKSRSRNLARYNPAFKSDLARDLRDRRNPNCTGYICHVQKLGP